jgi:hypothetical protein
MGPGRSCAAPSCASRSSASPPGPGRPRCCGCGGPAPASLTRSWPGGPTIAGSTWNTPSASPSRPLGGPPRGHAIPSRPSGGPGWCWPPTPSCAWPARPLVTSGCPGSGADPNRDSHPIGYAAGVRSFWSGWARRRVRQNRRVSPRPTQGPLLGACHPLSGDQEAHQEAPQEGGQAGGGRLIGRSAAHPADLGRRLTRHAAGLNHKLIEFHKLW